jgi:hypothetical protein
MRSSWNLGRSGAAILMALPRTELRARAYPIGMKLAVGLWMLCLVVPGCQRDRPPSVEASGHERGDCRPDKACDPGLVCLSNLCVRPPPADCQAVAEQITSIELGNYAEPEARAPVVAKYKAACDAALVSKEESQCLDRARDKWSAGQCAPRMFPELASTSSADCSAIVARTRAAMANQARYLNDPSMKKWFDRSMDVMQQSCTEDHWPDSLKRCLLASAGTPATTQACNQQMPPTLQQAMQARLTKAMQEMQGR